MTPLLNKHKSKDSLAIKQSRNIALLAFATRI
jgi:hypothetical protein